MKAISLDEVKNKISNSPLAERNNKREINSFFDLHNNISNGEIIVIASRPAMGKTLLLHNFLINQSVNKDEKILLLSANDSSPTILYKINHLIDALDKSESIKLTDILINPQELETSAGALDFIKKTLTEYNIILQCPL